MKNKTSLIQDKRTQEFIKQHNADELRFLEIICLTIVAILIIRHTGKVLVALFSRSVFINKPNYQKMAFSKDTHHLIGQNRNNKGV